MFSGVLGTQSYSDQLLCRVTRLEDTYGMTVPRIGSVERLVASLQNRLGEFETRLDRMQQRMHIQEDAALSDGSLRSSPMIASAPRTPEPQTQTCDVVALTEPTSTSLPTVPMLALPVPAYPTSQAANKQGG